MAHEIGAENRLLTAMIVGLVMRFILALYTTHAVTWVNKLSAYITIIVLKQLGNYCRNDF
jgi:hypothetical protein